MHLSTQMTHLHITPQFKIMVSATDLAKRALVLLLQKLATLYNVVLDVTRSSPDADIRRAYHRLSKKCHPDRGGENEHQQALNNAHRQWEDAKRGASSHGRPRKKPAANVGRSGNPASSDGLAISFEAHDNRKQFRFRSCAVLLTFQKFPDPCVWTEFLSFLREHLLTWGVQFWCATMETNTDSTYHLHAALHFRVAGEPPPGDAWLRLGICTLNRKLQIQMRGRRAGSERSELNRALSITAASYNSLQKAFTSRSQAMRKTLDESSE